MNSGFYPREEDEDLFSLLHVLPQRRSVQGPSFQTSIGLRGRHPAIREGKDGT